jgi:molybdate transport system regulatory protein
MFEFMRKQPRLWLRVIVPDAGAIGPGKIDLLRAIDKVRSISAAARKLGMSYRRAWMLIDETRRILGADVVETHAGGPSGGGARLTETGHHLIRTYDRICVAANRAATAELRDLVRSPGSGARRKRRLPT